jgi:hypothetical protein
MSRTRSQSLDDPDESMAFDHGRVLKILRRDLGAPIGSHEIGAYCANPRPHLRRVTHRLRGTAFLD